MRDTRTAWFLEARTTFDPDAQGNGAQMAHDFRSNHEAVSHFGFLDVHAAPGIPLSPKGITYHSDGPVAIKGLYRKPVRQYYRRVISKKPDTANLVGASLEEMEQALVRLGERSYRARQVYSGIYRRLLQSWDRFTTLPKSLRESLKQQYMIEFPALQQIFVSQDATRRYLFEVSPGQKIESVFIPEARRDTLCISSQVGCGVGCLFCVTGKMKIQRNLSAGEIVAQVLLMRADRNATRKPLNVVIMGMGEPLFNYPNVIKAVHLMTDKQGMSVSPRRITLSTAGVVPGIRRLAKESVIPNLAVSLCATTDPMRDRLIPINRKWNIAALLEACRSFPLKQRRNITFEYVLIERINDSPEDARRLVRLLHGMKAKVNLIPLNQDPLIPLRAPSPERVLGFQQILVDRGVTANIRRPRGGDISAACGTLAGRK